MHGQPAFRYDLQCPQCGAPAALGEAEQIVDCPYCQVRHLALSSPHPVSAIPPNPERARGSLLYLPYWRFKGMALAAVQGSIAHRLLDTSRLALGLRGLPISLGLRSQTQTLRFLTPETAGTFLRPALSRKGLERSLSNRLLGLGPRDAQGAPLQAFVGEALSLIYAPCFLDQGRLRDGLTGALLEASGEDLEAATRCAPPQTLSFLPALCPHCGWDLGGPRDSLVLPCGHCGQFWTSSQQRLVTVPCSCPSPAEEPALQLPFWEFQVESEALGLRTRADLVRLANLPRLPGSEQEEQPLTFRIPAFKINPALFLRLARQLTVLSLPGANAEPSPPGGSSLFPVTLPAREAFEALPLLVCRLARDKRSALKALQTAGLQLRRAGLHYLAFQRRHGELVQPQAELSLQENALRFGRML